MTRHVTAPLIHPLIHRPGRIDHSEQSRAGRVGTFCTRRILVTRPSQVEEPPFASGAPGSVRSMPSSAPSLTKLLGQEKRKGFRVPVRPSPYSSAPRSRPHAIALRGRGVQSNKSADSEGDLGLAPEFVTSWPTPGGLQIDGLAVAVVHQRRGQAPTPLRTYLWTN